MIVTWSGKGGDLILKIEMFVKGKTKVASWWKSLHGGLLIKNKWNITPIFLFILLFKWLTSYRSDRSPDFHTWWLKWHGYIQRCAFFGFRWYCIPFRRSNCHKNPIFGAGIGVFSQTCQIVKRSYYQNYCINHNQIVQSYRDPQILCGWSNYAPNKSKVEDGRHLEKSKNRNIPNVFLNFD